jgi:hypothetical protein
MNASTVIAADLITSSGPRPLRRRKASFLLESVEQAAGPVFLRRRGHASCRSRRPRAWKPLWWAVSYDHAAVLEPTVLVPAPGSLPEPFVVLKHSSLRSPRRGGGVLSTMPMSWNRCSKHPPPRFRPREEENGPRLGGSRRGARTSRAWSRRRSTFVQATSSRRCSRSGPNGPRRRARSTSTARCGASTRRRICSCSSSATSP